MNEKNSAHADGSLTNGAPGELLDIQIPKDRYAWIPLLLTICPLAILGGLAVGVAGRFFSAVPPIIWGAVIGLVAGGGIRMLRRVWLASVSKDVNRIVAQYQEEPIAGLIEHVFGKHGRPGPLAYLESLARALPANGRVGCAIRDSAPQYAERIIPITVDFEARALDEADESVVALEQAVDAPAQNGDPNHRTASRTMTTDPLVRRAKRNINLAGGWWTMGVLALALGVGA